MWQCTPVIVALLRWRQENGNSKSPLAMYEFETMEGYTNPITNQLSSEKGIGVWGVRGVCEIGYFCVALAILELVLALNSEIHLSPPLKGWN